MRLSRPAAACCAAVVLTGGLAATSFAAPSGTIETVAGSGLSSYDGEGANAVLVGLRAPGDVAALPGGGFLVADSGSDRIRRVSATGSITTVAGTGAATYGGDNGPASAAALHEPLGVAAVSDTTFLIADAKNNRIREVRDGTIRTVAGTGINGFGGDGGSATLAALRDPGAVTPTADGGFLVADTGNNRIRRVWPGGTITTIAGTGVNGAAGDGGIATAAELRTPGDVAVARDGDVLIADTGNGLIRRVDAATGVITTVAGGGSGPAGSPTSVVIKRPTGVVPAGDDGFVISDAGDHRVGLVTAQNTISLLAGTGTSGFSGDGGPAASAALNTPTGAAVTATGQLLIADTGNNRVRRVDVDLRAAPAPTDPPPTTTPTDPPPTTTTPPPTTTPAEPPPPATTPSDPPPTTTPAGPPTTASPDDAAGPRASAPPGEPVGPTPPAGPAPDAPTGPVAQTPDPVAPELGRLVVVAPASGRVLVRRPGASSSIPLEAGAEIPVGSVVDARAGTVRLTSSLPGGRTQTARFWGARFSVAQRRDGDGITELALRGGSFAGCPVRGTTARTAARRKPARRLWGSDKGGRFRTRGRSSVATVRGTRWLTEDTCAGTLTRVVEGAVDVRDLRSGAVRRVRAGQSLLVRAPGR